MKLLFALFIVSAYFRLVLPRKTTKSIYERVELLKSQIAGSINQNYPNEENNPLDEYEYTDDDDEPITPVMDYDKKKKDEKFKFRYVKGLGRSRENPEVLQDSPMVLEDSLRTEESHLEQRETVEPFYRREGWNDWDKPMQWAHCQYLVTPFLVGFKSNITEPKKFSSNDLDVLRLIALLSANTTYFSKEDVYSIIYQISNTQIMLFQWDDAAFGLLLDVIIKDKKHNFKTLKHGIKQIFQNWRLDYGNTTNLLKQARMFRPPCVKVSDHDGSTKYPKLSKYPKKKTTRKCIPRPEYDEDCPSSN